jgi:selenoprotein W-related protein
MASQVSIIYCRPCCYEKRARETAQALQARCNLDAVLVPGPSRSSGGIFEVNVGDRTVAKPAKGRFLTSEETVAAVAAAIPG